MQEEQQGHKIFVEQAAHEMHKGSYDLALVYLKKAIRVIATCWIKILNYVVRVIEKC